jgi:hypothetical protein
MNNNQYITVSEAARLFADYTITTEAMMCACFDQNRDALKNPESLDYYAGIRELQEE